MSIQSRKVFVDSSVLIAFIDRADPSHSKAVKNLENLARLKYHLYTSAININDVYTILARGISTMVSIDFLQASLQSDMEILFPQKTDFIACLRMLKSNKERQLSLKEVINATLMQRKGINQILTFTYWHNLYGSFVTSLAIT